MGTQTGRQRVTATKNQHQYDVLLVGGSYVGAALAAALAPLSYRIAFIDCEPDHFLADSPSGAVSAGALPPLLLNERSVEFLRQAYVWQALHDGGDALPVQQLDTHFDEQGEQRISALTAGQQALFWLLSRSALKAELRRNLARARNLTVFSQARCTAWRQKDKVNSLCVQQGGRSSELCAPLIVAADGAHASLCRLSDVSPHINSPRHSPDEVLLAVPLRSRLPMQHTARLFADGQQSALLLLPSPEGEAGTVWAFCRLPAKAVRERVSVAELIAVLANVSRGVLKTQDFEPMTEGAKADVSLFLPLAKPFPTACGSRPRLLVLGAAAADPWALESDCNLAWHEASLLCSMLNRAESQYASGTLDLGGVSFLTSFRRASQSEVRLPAQALDCAQQLFLSPQDWLRPVRHLGWALLNHVPAFHGLTWRQAVGLFWRMS